MWRSTILLLALITLTVVGLYWLVDRSNELPDEAASIHVKQAEVSIGQLRPETAALPLDFRDHADAKDARQATITFIVDLQVPPNRLWGMLLPRVEQNVRIRLNGQSIGAPGAIAPYPSRHASHPLYFVLPNGILQPGENTFEIDLHTFPPGRGFLGTPVLGPDVELREYYEQMNFVRRELVWFFAAMSLAMTLLIAPIAWQRWPDTVYTWFVLVCALWTLQSANAMNIDGWFSAPVSIALTSTIAAWFCACAFLFALRFIKVSMPRFEWLILGAAVAGTVIIAAVLAYDAEQAYRIAPYATMVQMLFGPVILIQALRRFLASGDPEVFMLLYTAGIIMVLGLFSMSIATGTSSGVRGQYLFYATPIVLGVFVLHLLRRFLLATNEVETLNQELEQRVARKTEQLSEYYARVSQMEQQQAIAQERERLMRDMHDGVGGSLVSSIMRLKNGDKPQDVSSSLEYALTDLRMMIDSLEVSNDLNTALGMLRSRLQPQFSAVGVTVVWHADEVPEDSALSAHATLQIMRIVQEAFTNVLKHAHATEIRFQLIASADDITVYITDDGRGMDAQPAGDAGHGLNNMHKRAASIGASLAFEDAQPGTRVVLMLPLHAIS